MNDVDLLTHLTQLEQALHHPGAPTTCEQLAAWLHPDFHEVGRSGLPYDRETVLRYLSGVAVPPSTQSWGFAVARLSETVALLTYQSAQVQADGQRTLLTHRSSVWVWHAAADTADTAGAVDESGTPAAMSGSWQLRYHQGTPAAA